MIAEQLKRHVEETGESMRALSLRSGLNAKAVSDIIRIPNLIPRHSTIEALEASTGLSLAVNLSGASMTYRELMAKLKAMGEDRLALRVGWLVRKADWSADLKTVCRRDIIDFFEANGPASLGVSKGSLSTYKSDALAAVDRVVPRARPRSIADIGGIYGAVHQALKDAEFPNWLVGFSGSFFVFLDDRRIAPYEITTETLAEYYAHRLSMSSKTETACRKHVQEIPELLRKIAAHPDTRSFGFAAAGHPFRDLKNKYEVADETIAPLMADFDENVAPWALGERSHDGQSRADFIAALDGEEAKANKSAKKAKLAAHKKRKAAAAGKPGSSSTATEERLGAHGFLTAKKRWSQRTLCCRRGYIVSLAKAVASVTEVVPETMEELTDPDFLEIAVETVADANASEFSSGYIGSVLKAVRKIAREYLLRPPEDLERINTLIEQHEHRRKCIAPRNKAKLRKFDEDRIQKTIDLGDTIIAGVNREIDRRRKAVRKTTGRLPDRAEMIDAELARDVMAALAHEFLLKRAPRSANVINIRLDWIARQGDRARIIVPAQAVKGREAGDDDLHVPLSERASRLLDMYIDKIRPKALMKEDKQNPFLFPSQAQKNFQPGRPYKSLLLRVTRLLDRHVGVRINPHLYRHLIGWIWLKDDLNNLPKVRDLLGHKSLQTTIDYYAELDEDMVFDEWQAHLDRKSSRARAA